MEKKKAITLPWFNIWDKSSMNFVPFFILLCIIHAVIETVIVSHT